MTVQLPRELLGAVNPGDMEWAVPGLQREKVVALLRLLPKAMRRRLGPAHDVATAFLESAPRGTTPAQGLAPALARYLATRHGVQVGPEPWSAERLDRRFDSREIELLEGPRENGNEVWIKGAAIYRAKGVPELRLVLEETVRFDGKRITYLTDQYEPAMEREFMDYVKTHGQKLGIPLD